MSRSARLVDSAAQKLAGKSSRRGFLGHAAVVGSALAVAPLRYLLHPQSAYAAIVRPWQCGSGLCGDGFTEFCCAINDGENACPPENIGGAHEYQRFVMTLQGNPHCKEAKRLAEWYGGAFSSCHLVKAFGERRDSPAT